MRLNVLLPVLIAALILLILLWRPVHFSYRADVRLICSSEILPAIRPVLLEFSDEYGISIGVRAVPYDRLYGSLESYLLTADVVIIYNQYVPLAEPYLLNISLLNLSGTAYGGKAMPIVSDHPVLAGFNGSPVEALLTAYDRARDTDGDGWLDVHGFYMPLDMFPYILASSNISLQSLLFYLRRAYITGAVQVGFGVPPSSPPPFFPALGWESSCKGVRISEWTGGLSVVVPVTSLNREKAILLVRFLKLNAQRIAEATGMKVETDIVEYPSWWPSLLQACRLHLAMYLSGDEPWEEAYSNIVSSMGE